jgi:hypothetical protein
MTNSTPAIKLPFKDITITSSVTKKGMPDSRTIKAISMASDSDDHIIFYCDKTIRDFNRWRFTLEPGCLIDSDEGTYVCEKLSFNDFPKNPILYARSLGKLSPSDPARYQYLDIYNKYIHCIEEQS